MSKKQSNPPPPKGCKPKPPPRPPGPVIMEGKTKSNVKPYNDTPKPDVVPPPQGSMQTDETKLCQSQTFIHETIELILDAGYFNCDAIDMDENEELREILKQMYDKYLK